MGRGARWATVHGVAESNTTEQLTLPLFTNIYAETHTFEFFWCHLWFPQSFGEQECNSIVPRFSFQAADIYSANLVQGKQWQIPLNSHLPNLILRHNDDMSWFWNTKMGRGGDYVHLRIDEIQHIIRIKDQALGTLTGLGRCEDREPAKEAEGAASVIGSQPGECVSQRWVWKRSEWPVLSWGLIGW